MTTVFGNQLANNVLNTFANKMRTDRKIKQLAKKSANSTDYESANEYAVRVGELASESLKENTETLAYMSEEVAQEVLNPLLTAEHGIVTEVTKVVQTNINQANDIGIGALVPELDTNRIDGLASKIASYSNFDEARWLIGEPIVNYTQAIVDQSIHKNAKSNSKMGLKATIIRKVESSGIRHVKKGKRTYAYKVPCNWCIGLAGTYNYEDVKGAGNDVYRRHENCRCILIYKQGDKEKIVWQPEWAQNDTAEQTKQVENAINNKKEQAERILDQKKYEKQFSTASNYSEAKAYAENVLGVQYVGIEQANIDFLNEMNKELTRIYDIFGNLNENGVLNYVAKFSGNSDAVACYGVNSGSVALRTGKLRGKNVFAKLLQQAAEQYKMGFWSSPEEMTVFRHEVGHAVEQLYYKNGSPLTRAKITELRNKAMKEVGIEYWNINDYEHLEKAGSILSYYGLRNDSEFIAESVSSYLSAAPKPLAIEVVETLLSEGKK